MKAMRSSGSCSCFPEESVQAMPCGTHRPVRSSPSTAGTPLGPERLPGPFSRRFHALRALGSRSSRALSAAATARSGDHGADPGRPPRPGPRGHGHPRARAPSLSSARKASRRRSRRGARSRWPRVRALAVSRAAARMGRDSESRSTSRGLESSSSSARSSAMATALATPGAKRDAPRAPPRCARESRAPPRHWLRGRGARARGAGRRREAAGPGGVGLSCAGHSRAGLCCVGLASPRPGRAGQRRHELQRDAEHPAQRLLRRTQPVPGPAFPGEPRPGAGAARSGRAGPGCEVTLCPCGPGNAVRPGAAAEEELHAVCGEPVLLHHGGADPRTLRQKRRHQEGHHGAGQSEENRLRLLLRGVSLCGVAGAVGV